MAVLGFLYPMVLTGQLRDLIFPSCLAKADSTLIPPAEWFWQVVQGPNIPSLPPLSHSLQKEVVFSLKYYLWGPATTEPPPQPEGSET